MANNAQAFPAVEVLCKDRVRVFCLNLGAFRALEEYLQEKEGKKEFSILHDFDWGDLDSSFSATIPVMWAGFYTDARQDSEPWTIERCEDVVSGLSFGEIRQCISASLERVFTPDQLKKLESDAARAQKKRAPKNRKR